MNYLGFELKEEIVNAIKDLKFKEFSEIQQEVLPKALSGKSLIGQSRTGSGKTHAFLIPLFNMLDPNLKEVQAIITAPTRELAIQIYNVATHMASFFNETIDIRMYSGGSDRNKEIERLEKTQPQIVIGTPGKIKDLMIDKNILKGYKAKYFVVDEADMTFDNGFLDDLDLIAGRLDNPQMLVFSATINDSIRPFIKKYIEADDYIQIKDEDLSKLKIEHILLPIKSSDKFKTLQDLLKCFNPYLCLIFANTKNRVIEVSEFLKEKGYMVATVHGGISPRERKRIMQEIHNLKYQFIVASDIAARGIDIEGISHVINYELPSDYEFYVHRSGRTGRANMDGICISLYDFDDENYLKSLEKKGIKFTYKQIKNSELVEYKGRNSRQNRTKPVSSEEIKASKMIKKPKKVSPGYKKKHKAQVEALANTLKKKNGKNRGYRK